MPEHSSDHFCPPLVPAVRISTLRAATGAVEAAVEGAVEAVDLTPDALRTSEGVARADAAADELDKAISNVAHCGRELYEAVEQGDRIADTEEFAEMRRAIKRWNLASNNLLAAIAGSPEQK